MFNPMIRQIAAIFLNEVFRNLIYSSRKLLYDQIAIFCQKTVLPENLQPVLINIFLSCALGILGNKCSGAVHCNVFPALCDII